MNDVSPARFAVAAVVVALVAWLGVRALERPAVAGSAATAVAGPASPGRTVATAPPAVTLTRDAAADAVVVHVAGAVHHPGVYRLREGQRIVDAVRRAGGATGAADLDAVNLAAKPRDGVQILIPRRAAGGGPGGVGAAAAGGAGAGVVPAAAAGGAPGAPVDLNTATAEQLQELDGVGPATAAKILQYRTEHGPFRSVDDLDQVSGIGPKKLAAIRAHARV